MKILTIPKKWWALVGISTCSFIAFIDFTIVNTALPAIQHDLTLSVLQLQWVMNGFLLFYCLFLAAMGRISDIYGHRRWLYIGVGVFAIASLGAGLAHNAYFLIIARGVQGAAEAAIIPCALGAIAAAFPDDERGRAIGIWSSISGLGLVAGPALGGILVSLLGWRSIFFIVVPIAIIGLLFCFFSLEESQDEDSNSHMDWMGLIFLGVSIAALIIPIMQGSVWGWTSVWILGLFVVSVVGFYFLYVVERQVTSPLIKFNLFANRVFFASSVAQFTFVFFNCAALFLMPLYLQNIRNEVPYMVGIMLIPVPAMVALLSPFSGYLVDKFGARLPLVTGMFFFGLSGLIQMFFQPQTSVALLMIAFVLMGIGWALSMGPSATAAISSVSARYAGVASGVLWTIQVIGGSLGLALGGLIFRYQDDLSLSRDLLISNVQLLPAQQTLVRSLLSDPENSRAILDQMTGGLGAHILSAFQNAFMAGYKSAMLFLAIIAFLAFVIIAMVMPKKDKNH